MVLTSLDNVKVLSINLAVLGKVEVLLSNENSLCGDRVSACPCMQQNCEKYVRVCHSHGSRVGGILTSEEVPGETNVSQSVDEYSVESNVAQLISSRIISCETPSSTAP